MKRKRQREVKPEAGLALTSNTNQYGAVLANGSANHNKEHGAAQHTTETRDQNAENKQQGIAKSKYTCTQTSNEAFKANVIDKLN